MSETPILTWGKTRILFAMATDQEYGDELQKRIPPLIVGVGPVEAALGIGAALATAQPLPDLVVSLGSAGSAKLEQGSVHEITSVSYRDMDASPLGFEKGVTPFLDQPATIPLTPMIDGVASASLSTGADIISGDAYSAIDADLVDMESFSIVRACQTFGVAFCGLRGVSDGAEELRHYGDWADYLHIVDEKLAAALDLLKAQLERPTH
ncbi:5'-methylthioadenosine/S-adenosylhomocysteine nucleosidase [Ahrensia marina]|uniref:5'-methylthioadenosine/S-adenosylhomocysteine nucleosidase n=1 Tax=Ahrensia marina TaxID=1514904 RepID=UPI0035CEA438